MRKELVTKSKLLSLVLRHDPGAIGITLDENGWASVADLLDKTSANGTKITREELLEIVETNEKKRFALDTERGRIRANQGHSLQVDVELSVMTPPEELFHGTALKNAELIFAQGLLKQARQHVHLSPDVATARIVGSRHGSPVVLRVASGLMAREGFEFYLSKNGVWLTNEVPARFLARV